MINEWGKKEVKIEVNQINYYDCYLIFNVVKMKSTTLSLSLSLSNKENERLVCCFSFEPKKKQIQQQKRKWPIRPQFQEKKTATKKMYGWFAGLLSHAYIQIIYINRLNEKKRQGRILMYV